MTVTITLASPTACDAGEILKLIYASSDVGLSATIWDECPVEREECKQIGFLADGAVWEAVWDIPRRKQQG